MTIKKLIIENFKGISERTEFEIKPITLFCGPNSSGKSSCLHALTALSQTTKISASHMPIILDDEYAHVHLGRFMDVIHDKNPESSFSIGIEFECILNKSDENSNEDAKIGITFKAKPHSQEIYISKSEIKFQKENIVFSRINEDSIGFKVDLNKKQLNIDAQESKSNKFSMQLIPDFDDKEISTENFFKLYLDLEKINQSLNTNLRNTFYLGPFRQGPLRKYLTRGSQPSEVGAAGEAAMTMLSNECIRPKESYPNLEKVSNWINILGLGKKVDVTHLGQTDLVDVTLTLNDNAKLALPDLGFGISQVLPVLVQCAFAPENSTLLFEQPELHLHDNASKNLASVFVDFVKEKNSQIIIETHSRHLFHELLREVEAGRIDASEIVLYDVSRQNGSSRFRKISIEKDKNGVCEVDYIWGQSL